MGSFRVRFAPVESSSDRKPPAATLAAPSQQQEEEKVGLGRRKAKSHHGCRQCKARRVKCDETLPVCIRCQKRGSLCLHASRPPTWQVEMPWLPPAPGRHLEPCRLDQRPRTNTRLLKLWFERTSFIMVLDQETNPLSFPIISHLDASSALVHALQSISAGHEVFFEQRGLTPCLEERGRALSTFRAELAAGTTPLTLRFWTCYLLGVSASYIDRHRSDYGREHLLAAHGLILAILSDPSLRDTQPARDAVGAYVYWDLGCSTLLDPGEQAPRSPLIAQQVAELRGSHHPVTGRFTDLFYLLGDVGRYCRKVEAGFPRDAVFEQSAERKLATWDVTSDDERWRATADAFRMHGLILLYRVCGYPPSASAVASVEAEETTCVDTTGDGEAQGRVARLLSLRICRLVLQMPPTSSFVSLQPTPLLTAGAELGSEDSGLRDAVRARLREVYSYNHLPGSVWALRLLEDVWASNDGGDRAHWLGVMLRKKWRLRLE